MSNELPSTPEQWIAYLKALTGIPAPAVQDAPDQSPATSTRSDDQDGYVGHTEQRERPSRRLPESFL